MDQRVRRGAAMTLAGALLIALSVVAGGAGAGASTPALTTTTSGSGCLGPLPCVASLDFGAVTLGTSTGPFIQHTFWLNNDTGNTVTVNLLTGPSSPSFSGPGADDYVINPLCRPVCDGALPGTITMTPGYSALIGVVFFPDALGDGSATMTITASDGSQAQVNLSGTGSIGYYQVDEFGDVATYGDAAWYGDTGNDNLNSPIVGMAGTRDNGGYWLVASDGGIFNFGPSAGFFGSAGAIHLNQPIVGMASTPDGQGYWLVASDGGIFSYGDAIFYGSTAAIHLNQPIVGMASTPDGQGYWLVASDGGIFSFGDAQFYGSTGATHLNKPIVGMAPAPTGTGYWLVASDGGIFNFGFGPGAPFYGSAGSLPLVRPITSMAAVPDGSGYWFSAADGGLFSYNAPFYGSGTDDPNLDVVVGMATDGSPPVQTLGVIFHAIGSEVPRFAAPSRAVP